MTEEQCVEIGKMVHTFAYLFPAAASVTSSIVGLTVLVFTFKNYACKIYYHINAKILIFLNILSCFLLSTTSIVSYGSMLINLAFLNEPCDILFETVNCSLIRRVFLFSFILTTCTHAAIIVERSWATYRLGKYEFDGKFVGIQLSLMAIFGAALGVGFMTWKQDNTEQLTSCLVFSSSPSIGDRVYKVLYVQLMMELFIFVSYVGLLVYHKNRDKFQLNENVTVLKQVGPLILTCCIIIGIYISSLTVFRHFKPFLSTFTYKMVVVNLFVVPHLSFVSILLLNTLIKWSFEANKRKLETCIESLGNEAANEASFKNTISNWEQQYDKKLNQKKKNQTIVN